MIPSSFRPLLVTAAILAAVLGAAGPASAHTDAEVSVDATGATTVTLDVGHGCESQPTVGLRVQLPSDATDVEANGPAGWTATVSSTELRWTGPALAADASHSFAFTLLLDRPAGSIMTFPTIQSCADGSELAWIELATPADPNPPHPAPSIVIGASGTASLTSESATDTVGPTTTARMTIDANSVTEDGSPTNATGRIVFLVACAVIVFGALAVFLSARRRKAQS